MAGPGGYRSIPLHAGLGLKLKPLARLKHPYRQPRLLRSARRSWSRASVVASALQVAGFPASLRGQARQDHRGLSLFGFALESRSVVVRGILRSLESGQAHKVVCALTIRPSRRRFAARLNSGVRWLGEQT